MNLTSLRKPYPLASYPTNLIVSITLAYQQPTRLCAPFSGRIGGHGLKALRQPSRLSWQLTVKVFRSQTGFCLMVLEKHLPLTRLSQYLYLRWVGHTILKALTHSALKSLCALYHPYGSLSGSWKRFSTPSLGALEKIVGAATYGHQSFSSSPHLNVVVNSPEQDGLIAHCSPLTSRMDGFLASALKSLWGD